MIRGRIPISSELLWTVAALAWGAMSLLVISEYGKLGRSPEQLQELWFVMSLLWAQFGFAAIFADLIHHRGRRFGRLLLRTLLPPLVLHVAVFVVL